MARRRKSYKRVYSRGKNYVMNGLLPIGGMFGKALIGAGAAASANLLLGERHSLQAPVVGGIVGGLPGAAGAYFARNAGSMLGGVGVNTGSSVYF